MLAGFAALAVPRWLRAAGLASSLLALALVMLGAVAGCGGDPPAPTDVTSDVDRSRADFLASDPIMYAALEPPEVRPGVVHNDMLGWNRTEVTARLFNSQGGLGPTPGAVEQEVAAAVAVLRKGGWTIHWQMCLPEPLYDITGTPIQDPIPIDVPRMPGHEWLAAGYKISDGVSYWVLVAGTRIVDGTAFVDVILRAPNARDSENLFAVAPDPLPEDQTCAEDGTVAPATEQAGTPTMMRDWWPFPAQQRSRDPNVV